MKPQSQTEITLPILHCLRCGHEWPPREPRRPLRCARCGSPYWDRPRREKRTVVTAK